MVNIDSDLTNSIFQVKNIISILKMEQSLEKIVKNTKPKKSLQIILSGNKSQVKTRFNPPIQLQEKKYEITLTNQETYYYFTNVNETNHHFVYSPDNEENWYDFYMPEDSHNITVINRKCQDYVYIK